MSPNLDIARETVKHFKTATLRPQAAVTQPFPTKPAAFDRQGVAEADLIDFTPEIKAEALKVMATVKMGPLYTPPIVKGAGGKEGMMQMLGGANWQGASADPETGFSTFLR